MKKLLTILKTIHMKMAIKGGFTQDERDAVLEVVRMIEEGDYR